MKKVILSLLIAGSLFGQTVKETWHDLSVEQRDTVYEAYAFGEPYGFGHTLAAIVLVESDAGLYRISTDQRDFGVTGINIKWYLKDKGIKSNLYSRSKWSSRLVRNDVMCYTHSIKVLKQFYSKYGTYKGAVSGYNNGSSYNPAYYGKIQKWVKFLKPILVTDSLRVCP